MNKDTNVKEYTFRPRRFGDMLGGAHIIITKDNNDRLIKVYTTLIR